MGRTAVCINANRLGYLEPSVEERAASRAMAIDRRRRSRADRREARENGRAGDQREIELKNVRVVAAMVRRREARKLEVHPIHSSYLYWSLVRIGHNVIRDEYRTEYWRGEFWIVPPEHCRAFRWWCELRPAQRDLILAVKRQSVQAILLANPKVLIDRRHDDGSQWGRLDAIKVEKH